MTWCEPGDKLLPNSASQRSRIRVSLTRGAIAVLWTLIATMRQTNASWGIGQTHRSREETNVTPTSRAPFRSPIRRLIVRSHKVSKPRDLYFNCTIALKFGRQIPKRCNNLIYESRGVGASRDLITIKLLPDIETGQWRHGPRFNIR